MLKPAANNEQKCMMNSELCDGCYIVGLLLLLLWVRLPDSLSAYVFILFTMAVNKDFLEVPPLW